MCNKIEVVAGILRYQDQFLAVQRGESKFDYISYKWEFPGGKIDNGESPEEAIYRELQEELNVKIENPKYLFSVDYSYPDFDITLFCFIVDLPSRYLTLLEHKASLWLKKDELYNIDWAAADTIIVKNLMAEI